MKKKIAITFPYVPFFTGGAEMHVKSLRDKLNRRGYQVEVVTLPFKWYPLDELWNQMMMWKSVDLSESDGEKIDLLIGTKWPAYYAKHDNKIIWLIHQQREAYDLLNIDYSLFRSGREGVPYLQQFRDADTAALKEAKKIFTISKNVSGRLKTFNGIDSEPLYHPPEHSGHYISGPFGDYVLSVGRLAALKRLDLLIRAMKYTDPSIKCLIGGTGTAETVEALKKLAQMEGVADRVTFLGFVPDEDLLRLYAESLCVYFAPKDEDYGYITLEAFFSHKPVVTTTDSGGVLEFAEDGVNAKVTEPDPEQIGQSINQLYLNKKLAREFGESGYQKVKDISWENTLDRLMAFSGLE